MRKSIRVLLMITAVAVSAMMLSKPALAEGGCGPYAPTICSTYTGTICVLGDCYPLTIDTYGEIRDQ